MPRYVFACFFTFYSLTHDASATSLRRFCVFNLQHQQAYPDLSVYDDLLKNVESLPTRESTRIRKALTAIFKDPKFWIDLSTLTPTDRQTFAQQWFARLKESSDLHILGSSNLPLNLIRTNNQFVWIIQDRLERLYFRQVESFKSSDYVNADKARKTIAAFEIQKALSLPTAVVSAPAVVTGKFYENGSIETKWGSISSAALGEELYFGSVTRHLQILKNRTNPESLEEAMAFQFLIGNRDVHANNFVITADRKIEIFDYDLAFVEGLVFYSYDKPIGSVPPRNVSPALRQALLAWNTRNIRSSLGAILEPQELAGLLLRRAILLKLDRDD